MEPTWQFEAGDLQGDGHIVEVDILRDNTTQTKAAFTRHLMQIWCSEHCGDLWRVRQNRRTIEVCFESEVDLVLFRLSREWDNFQGSYRYMFFA